MTTTYTYSIQAAFPNSLLDSNRLTREIGASAITIALDCINTSGDDCFILFKADLSPTEKDVLDALVAAHTGEAWPYEPPPVVAIIRVAKAKATIITPNWCDKCTWYDASVLVADETATDTGDHLTYALAHPYIIDTYHGRFSFEDFLLDSAGNSYRVKVWVEGVARTEQDPHYGTGGDYVVDYVTGRLTFLTAQQPTDTVTVSYHYATTSTFVLRPEPGKKLNIDSVELQFLEDVVMKDSLSFQPFGLVDAFAPQLMPGIPAGTKIPLGNPLIYKSVLDLINDANRAYPAYPPLGGTGWRGYTKTVYVFAWDYAVGFTTLNSSTGMEIRVSLQHDCVNEGTCATATFYCSSEAE